MPTEGAAIVATGPVRQPGAELAAPPFSFALALSRLRARLGARIREVNKISESEILSVGNGVHRIVANATAHIEHSKNEMLALVEAIRDGLPVCAPTGEGCGVEAACSREPPHRLLADAAAQAHLASNGSMIASGVLAAARDIAALTADLGSVVARAGATALQGGAAAATGADGTAALSSELERLLSALSASSSDVQSGAARLAHLLPEMTSKAQQIRADAESCATSIAERCDQADHCLAQLGECLETISRTSTDDVEAILRASRDALSHLQFQDVVAQGIMQLDNWIRDLELEAAAAEGKPADGVAPPMQPPVGEADTGGEILRERAGDILLF